MNALLIAASLIVCVGISLFVPWLGAPAVLIGVAFALVVGGIISRVEHDREFLLRVFVVGVLLRMMLGSLIQVAGLQGFFSLDNISYDIWGYAQMMVWQGDQSFVGETYQGGENWAMPYLVAAIYTIIGRNMLAVQFVNGVIGAATAPVIYLCAHHIFQNRRVARITAILIVVFPSLVLWSSLGLKDAPILLLLALTMYATLKVESRLSVKYLLIIAAALLGVLSLRFYVFYMLIVAIAGYFFIGSRPSSTNDLMRQVTIVILVGLMTTYALVLRRADAQLDNLVNLEAVQATRSDLAKSAESGFNKDVDVSTTTGALSAIPVGLIYLLFAPFPWQYANLRQSITLPEMLVWWGSFPVFGLGIWFTIKYRLRQALPVLLFTTMMTLAYSIFQGNIGTAYRMRAQLLVFYFIFIAAGVVLLQERAEQARRRTPDSAR